MITAIQPVTNVPATFLTLGDFNASRITWHVGSTSTSNDFLSKLFESVGYHSLLLLLSQQTFGGRKTPR